MGKSAADTRHRRRALQHTLSCREAELEEARLEMLERLALAAELRDTETGRHMRGVGELAGSLARLAAADSAAIPPAASGGSEPGNELVLLVEDQDEVRRVARRILTARGYRVVEARSGVEALAVLKAPDSGVDLVLTDAVMPLMSGTDLVRALRANNPSIPVIIASGYTDPELVSYCTGELKVLFLPKPFRSDELVRIVRETLEGAIPRR